jgi:aminoglycoside phosphotransferase (APT) family kinase protein
MPMSAAEESEVDVKLAGRLLAAQFPHWAHLPVEPVQSGGTDNTIFRLGNDMALRFPRSQWSSEHIAKEQHWLPEFSLPLAIPIPLAPGTPTDDYPWPWAVYQWLDGETATMDRIADPNQAAESLGQFVAALQKTDPTNGPLCGPGNGFRGVPLAMRDQSTREAIAELRNSIDTDAATATWDKALQTPAWNGPGVWLHGDLHSGNLLAHQGKLSAVIDFGLLAVGDPACDLMVAWTLLSADTREAFRTAVSVDDDTWDRGRGWALSFALIALAGYLNTSSPLVDISRHAINEALADN